MFFEQYAHTHTHSFGMQCSRALFLSLSESVIYIYEEKRVVQLEYYTTIYFTRNPYKPYVEDGGRVVFPFTLSGQGRAAGRTKPA